MTKGEALQKVASHVAGLVQAGTLEECTGLIEQEQDKMSDADINRLNWASQEVVRRLYAMGSQRERAS